MLALAAALGGRGHQVVLAGPPDFATEATGRNVDYRPMGRSIAFFLDRNSHAFQGQRFRLALAIKRETAVEVATQFDVLGGLAAEADRVVAASLVFAARSCAERAGRPYRFVALAPEMFPSRHHPGLGEPRQGLPPWLNRASWWATRRIDNWILRAAINRGRANLRLSPIRDALAHFADPSCALLATDAELAPAPPDVPLPAPPPGAMLLADERPLPSAVEAFLAAGTPPVYIGFGGMPDARPEKTREVLVEAVRRVGCRAIIHVGAGRAPQGSAPDILLVGDVPHERLFPRVAAVVHHGGAGTCARAARAGIPQVILPHILDQFPWAARLERRRLAPPALSRRKLTGQALAERIRRALDDPAMRAAAAAMARALAGRDGAERAAEILSRP